MARLQRLIFAPEQFVQGTVQFNPEQKKYLFKVLRLKEEDQLIAMDGKGHWWLAKIQNDHGVILEAIAIDNELPISITLVAAPPKGHGFENVIHSATELGARHILPLISERTVVKPNANKRSRWQKIAQEATEQSLRQVMPQVHQSVELKDLPQRLTDLNVDEVFFCSTQPGLDSLAQRIQALQTSKTWSATALITGPEGGWTSQEEELFHQAGYHGISLGKRVLRAVTAPLCGLSLLSTLMTNS